MGCEICGRGSCTRSFHSKESQEDFDRVNKTDEIKEHLHRELMNRIKELLVENNNLKTEIEKLQSEIQTLSEENSRLQHLHFEN